MSEVDTELENSDFPQRGENESKKTYKKKKFHYDRCKGLLAQPGPHRFVMVLDNLKTTFNIGKIYRSAQAFGVREMHVIGTAFFDPNPTKGALKHVPSKFYETFEQSYERLAPEGYTYYLLDPHQGVDLHQCTLNAEAAFVMGHEKYGIQFNPTKYTQIAFLKIPQIGKVESLNVSIAASIVMYEYARQHIYTNNSAQKLKTDMQQI